MLVIVNIADLHSAYDNYPRLARVVSDLAESHQRDQLLVLVNGDVFEYGNVVGSRSEGGPDWLFLERMNEHARVIVNIGNHEFDFQSPEDFMARAHQAGIKVIGNIGVEGVDELPRPWIDIEHAGTNVRIVGLATNSLNTYPPACREALELPNAAGWLEDNLDNLSANVDHLVIASHAGVHADRAMLEYLDGDPRVLFMVGGHNHLLIRETVNDIEYFQNGLKGERVVVARVSDGEIGMDVDLTTVELDDLDEVDEPLEKAIDRFKARHLGDKDLETVGYVSHDQPLSEAALWAVEALRDGSGVDVVVLNHTSFGSGLSAGSLKRHHFDEFIRFDNNLFEARIDSQTLESILAGTNQHRLTSIQFRSGDFLYASEIKPEPGRTYRLATSAWIADPANQARYLGTRLEFTPMPGLSTKALLLSALNQG